MESVQADAQRVRRTELAAEHDLAVRSGDDKYLADVLKAIQAEYADDDKAK